MAKAKDNTRIGKLRTKVQRSTENDVRRKIRNVRTPSAPPPTEVVKLSSEEKDKRAKIDFD